MILDHEIEPIWRDTAPVTWPSYYISSLTLQVKSVNAYYNTEFIAAELLNSKLNTWKNAKFDLALTAPKLIEFFNEKGIKVVFHFFCSLLC